MVSHQSPVISHFFIDSPHDQRLVEQAARFQIADQAGDVRMTSAFIEHLKAQEFSTVLNVSSVRGFAPMAFAALYSATKAGIHAYSMGLRYMLNGTSVEVQEIVPPWVQTDLLNSGEEPRAMPLQPFIERR